MNIQKPRVPCPAPPKTGPPRPRRKLPLLRIAKLIAAVGVAMGGLAKLIEAIFS
jgi:hypothetical protein